MIEVLRPLHIIDQTEVLEFEVGFQNNSQLRSCRCQVTLVEWPLGCPPNRAEASCPLTGGDEEQTKAVVKAPPQIGTGDLSYKSVASPTD